MSHCEFQPRLSAWYDGELEADEARLVQRHVDGGCAICNADMAAMRSLTSGVQAATRLPDVVQSVQGLHGALRAEADRGRGAQRDLWRTTAVLSALAASVLLVSATWLVELRPGAPLADQAVWSSPGDAAAPPLALSSDWETVATTLRADPRPDVLLDSPLEPRYADAIEWVLQNLSPAAGRDVPEGHTWARPGS